MFCTMHQARIGILSTAPFRLHDSKASKMNEPTQQAFSAKGGGSSRASSISTVAGVGGEGDGDRLSHF